MKRLLSLGLIALLSISLPGCVLKDLPFVIYIQPVEQEREEVTLQELPDVLDWSSIWDRLGRGEDT